MFKAGGMRNEDKPTSKINQAVAPDDQNAADSFGRGGRYQNEQWLRMLIDTVEDYAIFAGTSESKICTWNKGAEHLFGYAEEEILGKDFAIIFTPEDRQRQVPQTEVEQALQHGYSPDERWHLRKDGSRLFVSGAVRPLRAGDETVLGFLKVARDITGKKQTEEYEALY